MPLDTHDSDGRPDLEVLIRAALLAAKHVVERDLWPEEVALITRRIKESRV